MELKGYHSLEQLVYQATKVVKQIQRKGSNIRFFYQSNINSLDSWKDQGISKWEDHNPKTRSQGKSSLFYFSSFS